MTPPNKLRALLVVLVLGFWAGGAAAQSGDEGGWFDESERGSSSSPETSERPTLKIHGKGQYDPPPPDFRSEPASVKRAPSEDDTSYDEDEIEDPALQQQAVEEFSPRLAPYGYWVEDPHYGRVWVPNRSVVGPDFRPYVSAGHWELTPEDEWLWVSDYPFGGITFHYGRWAWLSAGSWGWVPGHVYAPAWVDFRIGSSGYVGWGPAPPYSVWRGGVFVGLGVRRPVPYIFCPTSYVFSSSLPRYVVYDRHRVRSISAQTYRYRPRYVAGSSVRVRSPSVREARIPSRYVPERRVIAEPRGGRVRSYRYERAGRETGVRERGSRRDSAPRYDRGARRDSAPRYDRGSRRDSAPRYDRGSRRGLDEKRAPARRSVDAPRPRGSAVSPPRGRDGSNFGMSSERRSVSPRWSDRPANGERGWRNTASDRRGASPRAAPPRAAPPAPRAAPAPRGRNDVQRSRTYSTPPQRRDASVSRAGERRGGEARRSGSGSSRSPSQQRSRDSRGSR